MTEARRPWPVARGTALIGAVALAAAAAYADAGAGDWQVLYGHRLTRATGWCATGALLFSLTCSPAHRLLRPRATRRAQRAVAALPRLRRSLGLAAAVFAFAHALIGLWGPLGGVVSAVFTWPFLRAGVVALGILALLFATSFPAVLRALRVREWKALHRLTHGAALLVGLHLVLGPFAPRAAVVVYAAAYGALVLARVALWRPGR